MISRDHYNGDNNIDYNIIILNETNCLLKKYLTSSVRHTILCIIKNRTGPAKWVGNI